MGLREKFLASGKELDRVELTITLHGEDHKVFASDLTGRQRIEFEKFMHGQLDDEGRLKSSTAVAAKLMQLGLVDEDGAAIFDKPDDYKEICDCISSQQIVDLARAIGIVSGIYSAPQDHGDEEEGEPSEPLSDDDDPHMAGLSPKNAGGEQENCL